MTDSFRPRTRWTVRVKWEPRDIWLGLYWTRPEEFMGRPPVMRSRRWFVCLVPCLPIIVTKITQLRGIDGTTPNRSSTSC